ncbi:GNAT family N-acetyltransferase [Azotobacter chroococcum]|uniref:GNAT family N-acetyltransferase n=1 Tax=Azotobacter chroococcum TaxID=353 RepID=UPI003100AAF5
MFLDEPRTRRIVCEPCAGSARMIRHLQAPGFARLKEIDFPLKRAAPMVLEREASSPAVGWREQFLKSESRPMRP